MPDIGASGAPFLQLSYEKSDLWDDYLFFTRDDRILKKVFDESYESMKAWKFGR